MTPRLARSFTPVTTWRDCIVLTRTITFTLNCAESFKSVEYANLVAILIEAVKEQQVQIEALTAEVKALKKDAASSNGTGQSPVGENLRIDEGLSPGD